MPYRNAPPKMSSNNHMLHLFVVAALLRLDKLRHATALVATACRFFFIKDRVDPFDLVAVRLHFHQFCTGDVERVTAAAGAVLFMPCCCNDSKPHLDPLQVRVIEALDVVGNYGKRASVG